MYQILIVEDNPTICRGIACSIDVGRLPVSVCAMAHDGEDAKKKFAALQPEIVVTDIRMPMCSGLELAEWIRARTARTQIIILSSYDEFSYARQALHLRCVDYLLKPTDPDELNAAVSHAISVLESQSGETGEQEADVLAVLAALCYGSEQKPQALPPVLENQCFCVASALHSDTTALPGNLSARLVYRLSGEIVDDYVFLSPMDSPDTLASGVRTFFLSLDHPVTAGISAVCPSAAGLRDARRTAQDALVYGLLFAGTGAGCRLFSHESLPPVRLPRGLSNCDAEFRHCFAAADVSRIASLVHQTVTAAVRASPAFQTLQTVFRHFLSLASSLAPDQFEEDEIHMMTTRQWFLQSGSVESAERQLIDVLCGKCRAAASSAGVLAAQITEVAAFIRQNIDAPLSLGMIAERFHLSPNYLATQFKKAAGHTVGQEITQARMEKAKEMLACSTLPMHRIADAVGYQNTEYFFRIFKKQAGVTPGEYREAAAKGRQP